MSILVIVALKEEAQVFYDVLEHRKDFSVLGKLVATGEILNKKVVIAQSGVGKVNAGALTASLTEQFDITLIINTGCAGGVHETVSIGDLVVAEKLFQHDVDLQALGYEKGFIPGLGKFLPVDNAVSELLFKQATDSFTAHYGTIASGDQFISSSKMLKSFSETVFAVEMEGAAVAHVAFLKKCPCVVVRAISDKADSEAKEDFPLFVERVSQKAAQVVIGTIGVL